MRLFETHAHLDLPDFEPDREALIQKCFDSGIEYIINIGFNRETSLNSLELAKKHPHIFATVGYHPHDATDFDAEFVKRLAREKKVLAIGEIGLDFFRNLSPFTVQRDVFYNQAMLAVDYDLPIVVHNRDAHQECFKILKSVNAKDVVFHCFSGDEDFARRVLDMGFYIGVDGPITYKASDKLRRVVEICPMNRLLVETDCPYLTPVPHRGKRNEPAYVRYVAEEVARVKKATPEEVACATSANARRLFGERL